MDLDLRVEALEKKIKNLEDQLSTLLNKQSQTAIKEQAEKPASQTATQPTPQPVRQPEPPTDWEHVIARVWLPRIFIVVFLLGVLWGFTAAVNAGFITQPVRCILGVAVAGFMYWQGEAQIRRSRIALGQVLLGGSIGVLILSLFAAHMLFGLIPSGFAFLLYIVSVGTSIFTALRHRSQALMIITLIAGYLVPFLVDSAKPNVWVFAGYEALFSIVMILLSLRYSYRGAYFVAFGVLHLPLIIGMISMNGVESKAAIILAVFLQHIVLYAFSTFLSKDRRLGQQITLYMSFGLLAAWMYGLYGDNRGTYEWMVALWSLLYTGTAIWLFVQKRALSLHLSIASLGWFLLLIYVLHSDHFSTAILAEGAIALCLGIKLRSAPQLITGIFIYFIGIISALIQPITEIFSTETFAWLVLLASIGGIYAVVRSTLEENLVKYEIKLILLWAELALFLIFFTELSNVLTRTLTLDYQHLILSTVWAVYAILLIVLGLTVHKPKARLAGIILIFVTLIKIIFADLPDVSTAIRAVLFIGLGSIGVAVSRLFYKRKG